MSKSKIAAHARNLNIILLFPILVLMTVMAAVIINGIFQEATKNRTRAFASEAAQIFYSYISEDLTLIRKAAYSKAITEWAANEWDDLKRARAFYEMMDYAAILPGTHLFFGISASGNEYTIIGTESFEDFLPVDKLDPSIIEDAWFFKTLESENEYNLNIGIDISNDTWHLWINHKVFFEGNLVGVFCSGLQIPDVFYQIFGQMENIRGYIIDKYGVIQLASAIDNVYSEANRRQVLVESDAPMFTEALSSYLENIDGFFGPHSLPDVFRLSGGFSAYVSFAPIVGTDWSVVVFYNSHVLSGISYLLPLIIVMLAALFLYVLGRNALMKRLIFTPLNRLTQSISGGKNYTGIYGNDRDDEIGELARTIQDANHEQKIMMKAIEQQRALLETMNRVSSILLEPGIDNFDNHLFLSLSLMAQAVDADRVYIWKNHIKNDRLHCTQLYEWSEGAEPQQDNNYTVDLPYENIPGWEETLSQGKCINSFVRDMSPSEQAQLTPQGILSILVVPVFVRDQFWGFVGFDDCRRERAFTENEEMILRSGSLMIANALLRNDMALNLRDTASKLKAVIAGYPGIIWCVDRNNVITLFNGRYLHERKIKPESFENKKCDDVLYEGCFKGIRSSALRTFEIMEAQDLNFGFENKMYRIRTTPIYDDSGLIANVMGSFDDITERTQLQKDLKAALDGAWAASQAKSNFLANMSHEMRTPLNAVIGLSELILEAGGLSEDAELNLEKIYNAGATLLSTVNDILDISKIEAGRLELVPVEYDIPSLINDAVTQSILRIGEKPITFSLDIDENLPTHLYGDDIRIKQILNNLLSNAFKYTNEGEVELRVSCERESNSVGATGTVWMTIRVSDTGIGIRNEDLEKLFSNYAQMDTQSNRKIEGTGLGLPITKKIAEMMDGTISIESEYGKGSVFTVRLRQQFVNDAFIGADIVKSLKEFRYLENKRSRNLLLTRVRMPYARVLVVDDVTTNLDVTKGMMKPYGMQVDCVTSGQEAIDAIRAEKVKYNAIFMDHMMPVMNGIEAVKIIREEIGTEYAKNIPIIALTANAIMGNEEMFLSKGFQAFISKPLEMPRLNAVLMEWVRNKELEEASGYKQIEVDGKMLLDIRKGQDKRRSLGRRSGNERRASAGSIAGLDMEKGLERFGGDSESYMEVLHSYAVNTRPLLAALAGVNADSLAEYAIIAHGIKGVSWGICAGPVGDKAEAMEKAAKKEDIDFVMLNNAVFMEAVENLVVDIEDMLDKMPVENPKPKKDKPDRESLSELLAACEAYDMDRVDKVMDEIESYEYESDGGLAVWLRENVDSINFRQIVERISSIINNY